MSLFNLRKYYIITCKFGHVGRDKYLPLTVPIRAMSKKDASAKAKKMGGVKVGHPDWCLSGPYEITKEQYEQQQKILFADPYWNKKTRQNIALFADRLVNEPNYTNIRGVKTNTVTFKKPTTQEIKMYHKKKREIIEKDYDTIMDEEDE